MATKKVIYTQASKVFSCCGQYIATTKEVTEVTCPRCGAKHKVSLQVPKVLIASTATIK